MIRMETTSARADARDGEAIEDAYPTRRGGATRILPRRDPVLHGARGASESGPIGPEGLERYARDGFWVMPEVLSGEEIASLLAALERWKREPLGGAEDGVIHEKGSSEQRSLFALHERADAFGALVRHPTLVGAARQILGGDVYVHQSRLNLKAALGGAGFSWHSDFETWHAEDGMPRMRALSASIFLTANHAWNGPLMLIPGSHQRFISCPSTTPPDHYRASLVEQEIGTPSAEALREAFGETGRIELALGAPGCVVLFECNTLHASTANLSPVARSNVFVCYNAVDNRLVDPFGATTKRPSFLASRDFTPISR